MLGQKYLALDPAGHRHADPDDVIPLSRTTSPYDVIDAFSAAATTIGDIDTDQLATEHGGAFGRVLGNTRRHPRRRSTGSTRLSETIANRDQELQKLFAATKQTTQVLADRNAEFERLLAARR